MINVVFVIQLLQFRVLVGSVCSTISFTSIGVCLQKDSSYQVEPRLSFLEGARDVAVLDAMLESGKRKGAAVQVKKF